MKLTQKRKQILDYLQKHKGTISAQEISKALPTVDLATVYRNLELFVQEKVIKKHQFDGREAQYEYTEHDHHHAICTDCDKVLHFDAPKEKILKLLELKGFNPDDIEIIVRGRCK